MTPVVYEEHGFWYHRTEDPLTTRGPFSSELVARHALVQHCAALLERPEPRNLDVIRFVMARIAERVVYEVNARIGPDGEHDGLEPPVPLLRAYFALVEERFDRIEGILGDVGADPDVEDRLNGLDDRVHELERGEDSLE
jgi:hypothetical protein